MIHSIGITSLQFDKFDKKIGSQISTKNPLVKKKIGKEPKKELTGKNPGIR